MNIDVQLKNQNNGLGQVCYLVKIGRSVKKITTDIILEQSRWDSNARRPSLHSTRGAQRDKLRDLTARIDLDLMRLNSLIQRKMSEHTHVSASFIASEFEKYYEKYNVIRYVSATADFMEKEGRARCAETYRSAASSLQRFITNPAMLMDEINSEFTQAYESWLTSQGLTANTTSFYMRILRAVYNRCVEEGAIRQEYPFRKVYTGVGHTRKKALLTSDINRIIRLDLSASRGADYARNIFLLSFMLRGMSMVDILFLKKSDVRDGYLTYRRHKTGQTLTIAWTQEMQAVADKMPSDDGYLISLMNRRAHRERRDYLTNTRSVNRYLSRIGKMLQLPIPLTMYVARHSWASAAVSHGIPINIISEGMGHDSDKTTRIYLSSIATAGAVDNANRQIMKSLKLII